MNFLNRKMFQAGGSANVNENYFFIDKINNTKTFIDPEKLYNDLSRSDAFTITSFVQNPDVTYSPATQEILRKIVYEKQSGISSVDPNMFKFGEQLPDYLTAGAGFRDLGGALTQGAIGTVESGINLFNKLGLGLGEGGKKRMEEGFTPSDIYPGGIGGERMPFSTETITGAASDYDISDVYDRGGMLRQGIPQASLVDALSRSGVGDVITDFSAELDEIEAPTPEIAGEDITDRSSFDFRDEDMRSKVSQAEYDKELARRQAEIEADPISQTLGVAEFDVDERRKAFEEAMKGRNEFGELIPTDRPSTEIDPIKAEIDKTLQEILPAEMKIDIDRTEADTIADTQAKFDGTFEIEKPDLIKVDTTVTEEDEETRNTARIPVVPKETTGLFGSDRFLDFIRNVGSQLVATGQMGEGLATGAAKAAEERTARELLKEQEEKKYQRDLAMAVAVQKVKNQGSNTGLSPSDLGALQTDITEISTTVKDYEGTEASIDIMNSAIDLFDAAIKDGVPITGLPGYTVRGVDKLKAFFGATDTNVSDSTKIQNYIDQVKQRSIREILNESGRTISNLDREIVDKVFGELDLTGDPKEIRKKLANARANLVRNNEDKKRIIEGKYLIIQNPSYQGVGIQALSPYLESILRIIRGQPEGVASTGSRSSGNSSVINIDL